MSVVKIIDDVKEWVEQEICSKIRLKVPPEGNEPNDRDYDHTLANPVAFAMYVPTKDKVPPKIKSVFPSVCVRFLEGTDDLSAKEGNIGIQLCFSAWDPGLHGSDLFLPNADGSFRRWTGPEANAYFQRYGDGWRDVWNFVDIALRAVESTTSIKGHEIDFSAAVKFGPLTEQEAIPDFYPLWFAWVSFQLKYPLMRNIKEFDQYL
jgi:hypothetical protein